MSALPRMLGHLEPRSRVGTRFVVRQRRIIFVS
jgi:hypothetical protein